MFTFLKALDKEMELPVIVLLSCVPYFVKMAFREMKTAAAYADVIQSVLETFAAFLVALREVLMGVQPATKTATGIRVRISIKCMYAEHEK